MPYKQHEVNPKTGWTDWLSPKMKGYKMACCDCRLVHKVDFMIVRFKSDKALDYEIIRDKNIQVLMRVRRDERCTGQQRRYLKKDKRGVVTL